MLCVAGAPFSLLDYESARARAREIAEATLTRAMPPWLPEAGHGEFLNARRLRDDQIALIQRWVEQGAPEGDAAQTPKPPAFPEGWQLGTPDVVVKSAESYTLQPGNGEVFRNFVFQVPRSSTRYVRAIEFRADNPKVLHHANVAVDPSRVARRLDRADPGPGFATMPEDEVQNVFGWSPGKVPILEPADTAWALEEGSDLVVQLHMVPGAQGRTGSAVDRTVLHVDAADARADRRQARIEVDRHSGWRGELRHRGQLRAAGRRLRRSASTRTRTTWRRRCGARRRCPTERRSRCIWIRRWDIRWQDQYRYKDPIVLPKGTTLRMRFTYDNSAANARSPRPPRRVTWGQNSTDEMGALWVEVIPRRSEDAAVLTQDYFRRALATDIASAELQVRNNPKDPAAHNRLALKYVQAGRIPDAQARLDEALRLAPNDAEAHSNLGTVLQMQGRLSEASPHLADCAQAQAERRSHPLQLRQRADGGGAIERGDSRVRARDRPQSRERRRALQPRDAPRSAESAGRGHRSSAASD